VLPAATEEFDGVTVIEVSVAGLTVGLAGLPLQLAKSTRTRRSDTAANVRTNRMSTEERHLVRGRPRISTELRLQFNNRFREKRRCLPIQIKDIGAPSAQTDPATCGNDAVQTGRCASKKCGVRAPIPNLTSQSEQTLAYASKDTFCCFTETGSRVHVGRRYKPFFVF
jgi:hypothetical protein